MRASMLSAGTAVFRCAGTATTSSACEARAAAVSSGTFKVTGRQKFLYRTPLAARTLLRKFRAKYQFFKVMLTTTAMKFINRHR